MNWIIIIGINGLVWAFLFIYFKKRFDRLSSNNKALADIKDQVNQLIMELDQTTERNIQLIEHRIAELKNLSQESSKEVQRLRDQKEDYSRSLEEYRKLGRLENPLRKPHTEEPIIIHSDKAQSSKDKVISRRKEGMSPEEIAAKEGIPLGEVELIIRMSEMRG